MDYQVLYDEITQDPLSRGYSGMTNAEIAVDINTEYRTRVCDSMSGDEVFQQTDSVEFSGLADANKQAMWVSFCSRFVIDPGAESNVSFVKWIFGTGSQTVANLASARQETCSRGAELEIGTASENDVAAAKEWGAI